MANPYDQFDDGDVAVAKANPYDQFDEAPEQPSPKPAGFKDLSAGTPLQLNAGVGRVPSPEELTTYGGPRKPLASYPETMAGAASDISESPLAITLPRPSPTQGRIEIPKLEITKEQPAYKAVASEVVNTINSVPEFFTSDAGIAALVTSKFAPRATSAVFAADMGKSAVEQAKNLYDNWDKMSAGQKGAALVDIIAASAFGLATGKHALTKPPVPVEAPQGPIATGAILPQPKLPIPTERTPDAVQPESPQLLRPVREEPVQSEGQVPVQETVRKDDEGRGKTTEDKVALATTTPDEIAPTKPDVVPSVPAGTRLKAALRFPNGEIQEAKEGERTHAQIFGRLFDEGHPNLVSKTDPEVESGWSDGKGGFWTNDEVQQSVGYKPDTFKSGGITTPNKPEEPPPSPNAPKEPAPAPASTGTPSGEAPEAGAVGRDWDLFNENLYDELDSFSPARTSGQINYDLNDVADRFVEFAKADKSGKPVDELVKDFAKSDEASAGQIRKLKQSVKSILSREKPAEPPPRATGEAQPSAVAPGAAAPEGSAEGVVPAAPSQPATTEPISQPKAKGKAPKSVHTDPSGNPVESSAPEQGRQYFRQDPESKEWYRVRFNGVTGRMDQHQITEWTWLEGPQKGNASTQYGHGGFFAAKSQVAEPYTPTARGMAQDRFDTENDLKQARSDARNATGASRDRLNEKARLLAARLKQINEAATAEEAKRKATPTPSPVAESRPITAPSFSKPWTLS